MEFQLEHRAAFTAIGIAKRIPAQQGYAQCPLFWEEFFAAYAEAFRRGVPETPVEQALFANDVGSLALCIDGAEGEFEYMIAGEYRGGEVPEGMKLYSFPESDWAVFAARGPVVTALQTLNTRVWSEWLPNEGQAFLPNGSATIEYYTHGDPTSPDYECGIRIPVIKK